METSQLAAEYEVSIFDADDPYDHGHNFLESFICTRDELLEKFPFIKPILEAGITRVEWSHEFIQTIVSPRLEIPF